jgi:hypothetical protein
MIEFNQLMVQVMGVSPEVFLDKSTLYGETLE